MKRFLFTLLGVLTTTTILVLIRAFVLHPAHLRSQEKKAVKQKHVERNPAVMDPALTESMLSPAPTPEIKGAFDQKSRAEPSPSP
jgi:hypothetical protein